MAGLAKKLLIKPGYRVALLHAPEGYPATVDLPDGAEVVNEAGLAGEPARSFDVVQLFVRNSMELEELAPRALEALKPGGILWLSYPKKSSKIKTDISRDEGWDAVKRVGLIGVSLISLDDTWSAFRFRPVEEVGK